MKLPSLGRPTAKVTATGTTGAVITLTLQLLQQYVPGFHAPSAATIAMIITVLTTLAGYVKKEVADATPAPAPVPAPAASLVE